MRLLVTLDGSALAERALAAIAPWARAGRLEVTVLAVINPADIHATTGSGRVPVAAIASVVGFAYRGIPADLPSPVIEDRGQALEAARIRTEEALQQAAADHLGGLPFDVRVEWSDDPATAIVRFAEEQGIDMIAMGTHGRSGVGQVLLGSIAASVVRQSGVPVLLVSEHMALPAGTSASWLQTAPAAPP